MSERSRRLKDVGNSRTSSQGILGRIFGCNKNRNKELESEEAIDVDRDIETFNKSIKLLNPRMLYQVGRFQNRTGLVKLQRVVELSVINEPKRIPIISRESARKIRNKNCKLIHLGLIFIGLSRLTRKKLLGTKVLLVLLDKGWRTNVRKAMIAAIEIDMNKKGGIFYCSPDFLMSTKDFIENIEIGIQTKGYEDFEGSNNLLVSVAFVGRLLNSSGSKFNGNIEGIIKAMARRGITSIRPLELESEFSAGETWNLNRFLEEQQQNLGPTLSYSASGRTLNFKF